MWRLERHCAQGRGLAAGGMRIPATEGELQVQLLASVPLSGEDWVPLAEGSVHVMRLGRVAAVA